MEIFYCSKKGLLLVSVIRDLSDVSLLLKRSLASMINEKPNMHIPTLHLLEEIEKAQKNNVPARLRFQNRNLVFGIRFTKDLLESFKDKNTDLVKRDLVKIEKLIMGRPS